MKSILTLSSIALLLGACVGGPISHTPDRTAKLSGGESTYRVAALFGDDLGDGMACNKPPEFYKALAVMISPEAVEEYYIEQGMLAQEDVTAIALKNYLTTGERPEDETQINELRCVALYG